VIEVRGDAVAAARGSREREVGRSGSLWGDSATDEVGAELVLLGVNGLEVDLHVDP
jgi:hypothetical protein